MDGENNGSKPYEQMDDLGVPTPILENTHICRLEVRLEYSSPSKMQSVYYQDSYMEKNQGSWTKTLIFNWLFSMMLHVPG